MPLYSSVCVVHMNTLTHTHTHTSPSGFSARGLGAGKMVAMEEEKECLVYSEGRVMKCSINFKLE